MTYQSTPQAIQPNHSRNDKPLHCESTSKKGSLWYEITGKSNFENPCSSCLHEKASYIIP